MVETEPRDAVVADTHAIVWFLEEDRRLSAAEAQRLDACDEHGVIYISAYTLVEVRYLVEKYEIRPGQEAQLLDAVNDPRVAIEVVPVTVGVAQLLPAVPRRKIGDPGDRIIVATAIDLGAPLVTRDGAVHELQVVDCIW